MTVLAEIALAAHLLRTGALALALGCLVVPLLLLSKTRWARVANQVLLAFGAIMWVWVAIDGIGDRIAMGRPFVRMAIILCSVGLVSALCAVGLGLARVRARYA